MTNKSAIMECMLLHNALNKLRVHLDAFVDGLEVMGVKELISLFPNVMKPFFVHEGATRTNDVVKMLRPHPPMVQMNPSELHVWQYLLPFIIDSANEKGNCKTHHCIKGQISYVSSL